MSTERKGIQSQVLSEALQAATDGWRVRAAVFLTFRFDPAFFEVRAAANAMLGDFTAAQNDQKKALLRATKFGWDTQQLKARLESYTASKPWTGNLFVL